MNELSVSEDWWLLWRARGVGLLLRILIGVSPLVALGCTLAAADQTLPVLKFVIIAVSLVCVVFPDSPAGLVVVLLISVERLVTVDDVVTPWSIAVAGSLAVLHASMAAASVIPPTAIWTGPMRRRWARRCGIVMLVCPVTWVVVVAFQEWDAASSQVLLAASVLVLAMAGVWARAGSFTEGSPR